MAVHCAGCGEELMGSVNRCWRCGQPFFSRAGPTDIPPIRRAPIVGSLMGAAEAEVLDVDDSVAVTPPSARGPANASNSGRWKRRGSPFATSDKPPSAPVNPDVAQMPEYPRHPGRTGAAVAAIVLAVIGTILIYVFPIGTLIVSVIGVSLGCVALKGERRRAAILALLLCCITFALGGFFTTAELYRSWYGYSMWDTYGVL